MGEDRALDEFIGGDEADAGESEERSAGDEGGPAGDDASGEAGVDAGTGADSEAEAGEEPRAVSTTAFAPDGTPCEACGATVRRRWRDDGALVCADCKTW